MNTSQYLEYLNERQIELEKRLKTAKRELHAMQGQALQQADRFGLPQLIDNIQTALHLVSTEMSRMANPDPVCLRCGVKLTTSREEVTLLTQYCDKCSN